MSRVWGDTRPVAIPAPGEERFLRAASLPDHLEPVTGPVPQGAAILITGAGGFVGGYLLRALLARTSAPIVCLVRGDEALARTHLLARLAAFGISVAAGRISVISGSITEPQFALPPKVFDRLTKDVGIIIHLAAQLDFRSSFDKLRLVNVGSLVHVLSLAAAGLPKRVVYVSSLSVLETTAYYGRTVTESTRLIHPELLPLGYAQTKWTAEKMLATARARGFNALCLRPSWIVGHDPRVIQTGFVASLMRIFAAVGAIPDCAGALNLVPVDFVAEACALLGLEQAPSLRTHIFHLGAAEAKSSAHFAEAIAAAGRAMDRVSISAFLHRVSTEFRQKRSLELMMFRHIFMGWPSRPPIGLPYFDGRAPVFDATASLRLLQRAGLRQPALDLAAFARCCLRLPADP